MGEIVVDIELENVRDRELAEDGELPAADIRRATIPAVADTGAIMLALPEDVVSQIGARPAGSIVATYADGRRDEVPVAGPLIVRIGERWMSTECIVLPQGVDALVGQLVLERLDLVADCRAQTLHPRPESPDLPLMRL